MKKHLKKCFILFVSIISNGVAQNNNEQLELRIENDKIAAVDKYYTNGLFLVYKRNLENNFIFKKNEGSKLQLNLTLGNEAYTPSNLSSNNPKDFDRPYAGWFFVNTQVAKVKNKTALFLALDTGITGEQALSGKLQKWAHEVFNIEDNPTWSQQIKSKFLLNLKAKFVLDLNLGTSRKFQYTVKSSLGTKDIFIENNISYIFGNFNVLKNTSGIGMVDKTITNEFFGFIDIGHRYVVHNTLIQGSIYNKNDVFTLDAVPHVYKFNVGVVLKTARNTFKFIHNCNTKETPMATSHSYGTLSYSRDF